MSKYIINWLFDGLILISVSQHSKALPEISGEYNVTHELRVSLHVLFQVDMFVNHLGTSPEGDLGSDPQKE